MDRLEVVVEEKVILEAIKKLASDLDQDYKDDNPIIIGVINGAIYFLTALTQNMTIPLEIDLLGLSSYGNSKETSGQVNITKDLSTDIANRKVIIIEDIVDTGVTLKYLKEYFSTKGAKSVETISLFIKEKSKNIELLPDRVLLEVPNDFLVGYGLDYANKHRNLKDLCKIVE